MSTDWERLGRELVEARKALGLTQRQVADRIGVSRTPIQSIERGDPRAKPTGTMRSYARLVGWQDGSLEAVLAGREPIREGAPEGRPARQAPEVDDLPVLVAEELREGALLGATVLDLTELGSDARMIVIMKGRPDASPEEIRRDLLAWRRTQRHLGKLGAQSESADTDT
ncbi:helix-turn-helix domain-containing protein [Wenjunlia vitaminophila]|uniref:helix-turn-helix domain-containing protein n=1 Tax=Wenjunlia vitaminophila TaxID=76728 RepID=UPI00037ECA60|nr:helix-turn-helix domain-containing protein [Wenjunlia vitaminophila]